MVYGGIDLVRVGWFSCALPRRLLTTALLSCNTSIALASFPARRGAAAELAEDAPGLELGVRALAGTAEPGVGAVGDLLGFRLVLPLVGNLRPGAALVSLIGEGDQAGFLQLVDDAPEDQRVPSTTT